MQAAELPTRRDEAWKYSDLRAALAADKPAQRDGRDVIERLARETQSVRVPAGEARTCVETMDSASLDACAVDFYLEAGASLTRIVVQNSQAPALSIARVKLATGARFQQFILAEGAKLARVETHVDVEGEGASVELNGVYMCAEGRHADLTSTITHKVPNATTRQLIKGVSRKGGTGVFQGKIVVEQPAQKTDARQYHHGLLLEEGAAVFAKPELLIHADDVQCAHGNTAGAIDENALFYARSRGVPEQQARAMLIEAFLLEAVPEDLPEEIRADLLMRIQTWLGAGS